MTAKWLDTSFLIIKETIFKNTLGYFLPLQTLTAIALKLMIVGKI
jgi:hypothetical protein